MTATTQPAIAPVATSIENPGDWGAIARQIEAKTGVPTPVTPEVLTGMIASAAPLLFAADARRESEPLRGTFADAVIAQREQNAGDLEGERPLAVTARLVGAHVEGGRPVVRAHLAIRVADSAGVEHARSQFWDVALGERVTVGAATCPNCGAPIAAGHLTCSHCQADVRSAVEVPLLVTRLELY